MKIKAIVVDDEKKSRLLLVNLINEYLEEVEVIGQAENVPNAVKLINSDAPDLVFLDIEMPGFTGFQIIDFFEKIDFGIIFVTAYEEYALKAFEVSAVDYLLKPIQIDKLLKSVQKFKDRFWISAEENKTSPENNKPDNAEMIDRIAVPVADGLKFISTANIIYLHADRSYTNIHLSDGKKLLISKNLKEFVKTLNQPWFFKPHRSYLINLNKVSEYVKKEGGYIIMDNGDIVSLSREKRDAFLLAYKKIQ